jgi:hypothetical protein
MDAMDYTVTITREAARERGAKRYFNGVPCKHGHLDDRLVINGSCVECSRLRQIAAYYANREENLRKQKIRRDSDPDLAVKKKARKAKHDPEYLKRSESWWLSHEARRLAADRGESQFFTGQPCQNGHIANRFTNGGKCVECSRLSCLRRNKNRPFKNPVPVRFRRSLSEIKAAAAQRAAEHAERVRPWHEAGRARRSALEIGAKTYQGCHARAAIGESGMLQAADALIAPRFMHRPMRRKNTMPNMVELTVIAYWNGRDGITSAHQNSESRPLEHGQQEIKIRSDPSRPPIRQDAGSRSRAAIRPAQSASGSERRLRFVTGAPSNVRSFITLTIMCRFRRVASMQSAI